MAMMDSDQKRLVEACDKYGLPHSVDALVRHIENNRVMAQDIDTEAIRILTDRVDLVRDENDRLRLALEVIADCDCHAAETAEDALKASYADVGRVV